MTSHEDCAINMTIWEQDWIWSRAKKSPDVLIRLGASNTKISMRSHPWLLEYSFPRSLETIMYGADSLISSLFYIQLVRAPVLDAVGFVCQAQIRCRLMPSRPALRELVDRLLKCGASFSHGCKTLPCVNPQLYREIKGGSAFSLYFTFSAVSLSDKIDVKIDGITREARSISNCPYVLRNIVHDQGLDCVFGRSDHRRQC
jgi:hypothetical protein